MENNSAYPDPTAQQRDNKKRLLIIGCCLIIGFTLILLTWRILASPEDSFQFGNIPTPTAVPGGENFSAFITIPPENIRREFKKTVKNIHWLSNTEVAYSYYDASQRQTYLAKTDGRKETILSGR